MGIKVKSLEEIKTRYSEAASIVPSRYKRGIESTTGWKERATSDEAEDLWAAKLSEAIAAKRRKKALEGVDEGEWKRRASEIGATVIGTKMAKSVDKFAKAFAPYREALAAVDLPPRTADAMANIDNRLKKVVEALISKKKELKG